MQTAAIKNDNRRSVNFATIEAKATGYLRWMFQYQK
jgi:hypothetical protein